MKQKDIALILIVAIISGVLSVLITSNVFVGKKGKDLKAENVSAITAEFKKPDDKIFNENAINPTQLIQIGDNNNPNPL
jgi:hypothetical protein